MSLQLHRPDGRGGVEEHTTRGDEWRRSLLSPRWGSSRRSHKLPDLKNPEMNPAPTMLSVLFWLSLGAVTFVLLVAGYGSGFWH